VTAIIMPRAWWPESFRGLPRVRQHQRVYDALGGRMGGVLHALQLTTAVPTSGA
jgi:stress-induced morphogen